MSPSLSFVANAVLVMCLAAAGGRMVTGFRYLKSAAMTPAELLGLPPGVQLLLVFQPADCNERTEPIVRALKEVLSGTGKTPLAVLINGGSDAANIEKTAIRGGIDFPIMYGRDWRTHLQLRRLGFAATPVVLAVDATGQVRFAASHMPLQAANLVSSILHAEE